MKDNAFVYAEKEPITVNRIIDILQEIKSQHPDSGKCKLMHSYNPIYSLRLATFESEPYVVLEGTNNESN